MQKNRWCKHIFVELYGFDGINKIPYFTINKNDYFLGFHQSEGVIL